MRSPQLLPECIAPSCCPHAWLPAAAPACTVPCCCPYPQLPAPACVRSIPCCGPRVRLLGAAHVRLPADAVQPPLAARVCVACAFPARVPPVPRACTVHALSKPSGAPSACPKHVFCQPCACLEHTQWGWGRGGRGGGAAGRAWAGGGECQELPPLRALGVHFIGQYAAWSGTPLCTPQASYEPLSPNPAVPPSPAPRSRLLHPCPSPSRTAPRHTSPPQWHRSSPRA